MIRILIFGFAALILPAASYADGTRGYIGYAGYNEADQNGLEVAIGYSWALQRLSVTLNYLAGVFYEGEEPEHYREETSSAGSTICRDQRNGQFAEKEKCQPEIEFDYAPSIEIDYWLTPRFAFGVGYRGGDEAGAVGLLSYKMTGEWFLSVRAGSDYHGIGVGVSF